MKIYNALLAVTLLASCTSSHIEFNGKAPGITNGVFLVKEGNNTLFSDAIKTGSFHAAGELQSAPGYYMMDVMDNSHTNVRHEPYEVYLEPGTYNVEVDGTNLNKYPTIKTSSKIQQDLSAYYEIYNRSVTVVDELVASLNAKIQRKNLSISEYTNLSNRMSDAESRKDAVTLDAFRTFMREHPNSEIAAHLMADMDYEHDPAPYNAIYQKMSPAAKNSPEGKEIGAKLTALIRTMPGADAPDIAGATPEGKKFDRKALDKQIYVIDFWRAGNEVSRLNHQDIIGNLLNQIDNKKAGIISISLDSRRDWWTTAIKDDHLTWAQYADLKGDNSANAQNWAITTIPTYYLVDSDWKIIQRDVSLSRLSFEINDYLKHHSHRNHAVLQYSKNMIGRLMPYSYASGKFTK